MNWIIKGSYFPYFSSAWDPYPAGPIPALPLNLRGYPYSITYSITFPELTKNSEGFTLYNLIKNLYLHKKFMNFQLTHGRTIFKLEGIFIMYLGKIYLTYIPFKNLYAVIIST